MSRPSTPVSVKLAAALGLAALVLAPLAVAQAAPAASGTNAPSQVPEIQFEKYTLPNGLQVILHVDRKLPIVHVNQWYHVGSKNEKPGRTGFAHLFEHMMFQGSKNVPGEYFSVVEELGANLQEGGVNGTTDNDRTNYFATVPSGNLEKLLWLESDRLATLIDGMDQAKLDNQREVVKNERRQGVENQPYGRWIELLASELFPFGHPYSWSVIGSMADLNAAALDDVKEFFRTYYTPNNLSLVVAGDFDPVVAKQLVEKYFGSVPPGPALARPKVAPVTLAAGKTLEIADRVPQQRVYMVWPTTELFGADDAELDLAARVLTDGLSSRLTKALVYDAQQATTVNAFQFGTEIANCFVVIANARPGVDVALLETLIAKEIARLAATGPTPAELERAKNKLETQYISGLERIGGFGGKADLLNQYNTYLGDPGRFAWDLARWRSVTPAGLQRATRQYLDTDKRLTLRFRPEASTRAAVADPDRSAVPAVGAEKRFVAPEVATRTLANGLQIFVVERRDLPKVAVQFTTRAGMIADPPGKEGTAHLMAQNIDLGTAKHSALEIESALGDLGTVLTGGAAREGANLQFEVLTRNVDAALGIVSEVIRSASFPAPEFEREKQNLLANLQQQNNNPNAVAGRVRNILAFGREHPYGRPAQGLPGTVETITRDDIARFWQERVKPGSSALVFVGGLSLDDAAKLAEKHFGAWSGGAAAEVPDRRAADRACREDLPRRSPGRGADGGVAVPDRAGDRQPRRRRPDPRRLGLGRRRLWHPPEPQPARGQGLLVRRLLQPPAVHRRRRLVRRRRRADRQDSRVGRRVRPGVERPRGRSPHRCRRARELAPAAPARHVAGVRGLRQRRREDRRPLAAEAAALRAPGRARPHRPGAARGHPRRGGEVGPPREGLDRRRRRPREDRGEAEGPEPRRDRRPRRRRQAGREVSPRNIGTGTSLDVSA